MEPFWFFAGIVTVLPMLEREQVEQYYLGYSNKCLWPLFHYFGSKIDFRAESASPSTTYARARW